MTSTLLHHGSNSLSSPHYIRIRPPGSFPLSTDLTPTTQTPRPRSPPSIFVETPFGTLKRPGLYQPLYCPNCRYPLIRTMSRQPASTITAIVKPGQLAHAVGPSNGTKIESASCISSQNVSSVLASNPVSGGNFIIFRRKQRVSEAVVPKPPAITNSSLGTTALLGSAPPQTQTYDVVSGHGYRITATGSVLYVGRERALESVFVRSWITDKGALQKIEPLRGSRREYRFCLFGPGNHTSFFRTFDEFNGRGSWRQLLGEEQPQQEDRASTTHAVFMELPEVVAQMIALGVKPTELARCLKQGEYGTLRLQFKPQEWTTPDQREVAAGMERDKAKAWKRGWWYTARKGMGVWIS